MKVRLRTLHQRKQACMPVREFSFIMALTCVTALKTPAPAATCLAPTVPPPSVDTSAGRAGIGSIVQSCKMASQSAKSLTHIWSPCHPNVDCLIPVLISVEELAWLLL